jgi:hypothetical protein
LLSKFYVSIPANSFKECDLLKRKTKVIWLMVSEVLAHGYLAALPLGLGLERTL